MKLRYLMPLNEEENDDKEFEFDDDHQLEPDNNDDLIFKGARMVSEPGQEWSKVIYAADFDNMLKGLYLTYKEVSKYKTSAHPKVSALAKMITKYVHTVISDIRDFRQYLELVKKGMY